MMDDTEEERARLLESIRLQDEALSLNVDKSLIVINSDSDDDIGDRGSTTHGDSCENTASSQPSWTEALEANQQYDDVLAQVEVEIKRQLVKVTKDLEEVQHQIQTIGKVPSRNMKSHWLYVFGMPYFKTTSLFHCPFNSDYYSKKRNNELCYSDLPPFHLWTKKDKKKLSEAVKQLSIKKCRKEANLKLAVMRKELEAATISGNIEKAHDLSREIENFDVEAVASLMLKDEINNGNHDWLTISATFLEGIQPPDVCERFWNLYLHPNINKGPYTNDEEKKLAALAKLYNFQDWDSIAKELGTNRSGYQCFIVYQNKLNLKSRKSFWDAAEDRKLVEVVEKFRINDFIPWNKVVYYMEGRTKTQCFNRWTYSLNPAIRKGRFTHEEDIMIMVGVQMWGKDFQKISRFLKERTTNQVRDRYNHYLSRNAQGIPWTLVDDELLFTLVEKYGKNWAKISDHFPSKDRTQVRHRYTTLMRWRSKFPDAPLTDAPSRNYLPPHCKESEQWQKAQAILKCESVEAMIEAKNSLVSSLKKSNKKSWPEPPKKKKHSPIEQDLINYFRCSYDVPGGHMKNRLQPGEARKCADELSHLLQTFGATLNLPSCDEIKGDPSLCAADKDILSAYMAIESIGSPSTSAPSLILQRKKKIVDPCFRDSTNINSSVHDSEASIDCLNDYNLKTLYVDLPLMDFDGSEVVCDRNKDPSFFEPSPVGADPVLETATEVPVSHWKESYICPPNFSTLVGMRTYLLNRRNLVESTNEQREDESAVPNDSLLKEAKRKFNERLLCLFLWPGLMSRFGPSSNRSIFLDDTDPKEDTWPVYSSSTKGQKRSSSSSSKASRIQKPVSNVFDEFGGVSTDEQTLSTDESNLAGEKQPAEENVNSSVSCDITSVPPKKRKRSESDQSPSPHLRPFRASSSYGGYADQEKTLSVAGPSCPPKKRKIVKEVLSSDDPIDTDSMS